MATGENRKVRPHYWSDFLYWRAPGEHKPCFAKRNSMTRLGVEPRTYGLKVPFDSNAVRCNTAQSLDRRCSTRCKVVRYGAPRDDESHCQSHCAREKRDRAIDSLSKNINAGFHLPAVTQDLAPRSTRRRLLPLRCQPDRRAKVPTSSSGENRS